LEHTIKQHVTVSVVDDSMESAVRDQDHVPRPNHEWFISLLAHDHFAPAFYKKVHLFLAHVPVSSGLLTPIEMSGTQDEII
jgi:hypothetical protein